MKKNLVYAMMSAIALTSAVSFTSCASDDGASVDTNPTYDGKSVRTDFAFSITKASEETRMTGANVQETAHFRGMSEMFLLPFSTEPAAGGSTNAANFPLGTLTNSDISDVTVGDRTKSTSSKVYSLMLPLGTNNFLFYGKATNTGNQSGFDVGKVTTTLTKDTKYTTKVTSPEEDDGIYFSLNSIVKDEAGVSTDGLNTDGDATRILNYLNAIANTTGWAGTVATAQSSTADAGTYRALAKLYTKFTNTNNSGPRAGSAEAIARTILDLYKSARDINGTSSVQGVKDIANAICSSITTVTSNGVNVKFYKPGSGDTPVELDGTSADGDPDTWTAVLDGLTGTNANTTFPANLGLPMGAAQLQWDLNSFKYNDTPTSFSGGVVTAYSNSIGQYRYPAELIYYCNSPLLATDKYKTVGDYPTTAANWDIGVGTGGFSSDWSSEGVVTPSTRAVAMQNNVNYGVALLETTVRLKGGTLFDDNRAAILADDGVTENQHDIDGTKFKVTGLLIGGQPETVGWNMVNPNASDKTEIIYDKEVQYGNGLLETASSPNYTVVFDNYTTPGSNNEQPNVLIALQIKNGDKDFYGYDGLIPAGSTFYLVGTLNPTHGTTGTTDYTKASRPASYRITEESVQRVFMQDYKTVASIGLSNSHALKRAYSTIPDLRSTEIVFGLSVDLKWEKGVSFDITIN